MIWKSTTRRFRCPEGNVFITLCGKERPERVFVHVGKAGMSANGLGEALGALVGRAIRHGATIWEINSDLKGISSDRATTGKDALSIPDAIASALVDTYGK